MLEGEEEWEEGGLGGRECRRGEWDEQIDFDCTCDYYSALMKCLVS